MGPERQGRRQGWRPCEGQVDFLQLCLLVKQPSSSDFERHYETSRGFDYEWGFTYGSHGRVLQLNLESGEITNATIPEEYVRPPYREGWSL